jgi:predicted tellurium resistance membrane protein TerC
MKQPSITSLPVSPDEERRSRMRKYSIAMSVRMACIVLVFVVPGWWMWVFALGAIILPYIAVVLANVGDNRAGRVEAPGPREPLAIDRGFLEAPPAADRPTGDGR